MSNPREYRGNSVDRQRPSRRAFLITSASACGALAFWSVQGPGGSVRRWRGFYDSGYGDHR